MRRGIKWLGWFVIRPIRISCSPPARRPASVHALAGFVLAMANREYHHLYNTAAWRRARAAWLREHPLCRMHGELGQVVPATVVDHIVPHRGDVEVFWDRGRWQSLCKRCHDSHKQAQEHNADGLLRGAGLSGAPIDAAHPWHRPVAAMTAGGGEKSGGYRPSKPTGSSSGEKIGC